MAIIALEGMYFHANHGYYEEEQLMGGEFVLDVYVTTSIQKAAMSDDLEGTINYETVYFICKAEMKKTSKMLETVVQNILDRLNHQYGDKVQSIKVRLKKLNPPLGGKVTCAYVESESGGASGAPAKGNFRMEEEDDDMDFDDGGFDFM